MCGVDVQDQLCGYYTLQNRDHKWWHWVMFDIIDITIINLYIIFKVHMTWLNKLAETISHLKFNMALARAFIQKKVHVLFQKHQNGRDC
jgi:L-asparagine transporter-like permease